jgi:TonB family protein
MNRLSILLAFTFFCISGFAQEEILEIKSDPPQNVGGKKAFEHTVMTQMIIPDKMMKMEPKEATIYFTVTKEGEVIKPFFKEKYGTFIENESRRLLNYFIFRPGKQGSLNTEGFGSLTFNFFPDRYKVWVKERNKYKVNLNKPADSTFVIYEIADKSPEFYKGDDALGEFILDNIEYPNVAKQQSIEGTVKLSFIIETNGYVSNVEALTLVGGGCTDEAIRIVNLLRFKPAEKNGKYVRYKTTYPITFNLKIVNKDFSSGGQ